MNYYELCNKGEVRDPSMVAAQLGTTAEGEPMICTSVDDDWFALTPECAEALYQAIGRQLEQLRRERRGDGPG